MKPGPYFFAWCDEAERVDAFGAALSALVKKEQYSMVARTGHEAGFHTTSVSEVVATVRAQLEHADMDTYFVASLNYDVFIHCIMSCFSDASERLKPKGPIQLYPRGIEDFVPTRMDLVLRGDWRRMDAEAEAQIAWHMLVENIEDVLLRLCAPDASGRVSAGGCTTAWTWLAPVGMCATYNAKAEEIARDLALSWVSLHDKEKVSRIAGMSLEALHARVDAAPHGACVLPRDNSGRSIPLSREAVLKALATPPSALLSALEASAGPDGAWRAAEPRAQEIFELTLQSRERERRGQFAKAGEDPPLVTMEMTSDHVYFLVDHAPFYIRRLPSGGVLLATHPYRTLWPLWADALFALGLMS
jgi:hypothetical protein